MNNRIYLHDRTENILKEYLNSDAFLMSSDYEGMPNALMEAMCVGLPCICTDCLSGPGELIGDDERGYLIPCGDENRLTETICRIVDDPDEAFDRAEKASEYIRKTYHNKTVTNRFIVICEKMIQRQKL